MAEAHEFHPEKRRCVAAPSVGQTRYLIKVVADDSVRIDNIYKFQTAIPRTVLDRTATVRGPLGREGTTELYACGRWFCFAVDDTHLHLREVT